MDKRTFLKELERSLSVLQRDELSDIVGEYEQHIDMKVQSGLTEEEAIADFGSLPELSAEILEAYHVRSDYKAEETEKGKRFSFAEGEKSGKEILEQTGEICAKTGRQTMRGLKWIGAWIWGVLVFLKTQIVRPFTWAWRKLESYRDGDGEDHAQLQREEDDPMQEQREKGTPAQVLRTGSAGKVRKGFIRNAVCAVLGLAVGVCRFCWKAAGWCVRIAWNVCWVGFSVFCGSVGLFCLFGMGMLVVLLANGYPLAGAAIGVLGLNLCLFSAAGLGMTLLWRKGKKNADSEESSTDKYTVEQDAENQIAENRKVEEREYA